MLESPHDEEYVEVIIDTAVHALDRPFHYRVPGGLRGSVQVGSMVLVPFSGRLALGYVVGAVVSPVRGEIKDVSRLLDEAPVFDFDTHRLCRWIAGRYLCSLSQAFRLVLPPGRGRRVRQYLAPAELPPGTLFPVDELTPRALEIMEFLAGACKPVSLEAARRRFGADGLSDELALLEEACLITRSFSVSEPAASARRKLAVRLSEDSSGEEEKLTPRQLDIVTLLRSRGGVEFRSVLLKEAGASDSSLKSLVRKGLVEIFSEEARRLPRLQGGVASTEAHVPDRHQRRAIEEITASLASGRHAVLLLEGVTGSGKTEVYLRSIEWALDSGKSAIMLVPEISLTPQTVERFESRFPGQVAVLHSRLGPGERFDQWRAVCEGRHRVVVGARSAVFAPMSDLGLIVIDEEQESSYKNDSAPRYHAREVAEARARMSGAVVVLGSATPSFETVKKASAGLYRHLLLPERIDGRPLPGVEVVDMRSVGGAGFVPLVSPALLDALSRTVEAGEQALLFLNRRGFANFLQCRHCGEIPGCGECEVSLCFHRAGLGPLAAQAQDHPTPRGGPVLMCHHCAFVRAAPIRCTACGEGPLKTFGAGTERVEEEVRRHLPGITVIRMDADTTRGKDAHWHLLSEFYSGRAQVLIGTQMVAKGLDIPGVTLVGVINADTALALPDFRAAERTYQLLTQVSGRAGRGLRPGRVVVQTFNPGHPAVRALSGDEREFIDEELEKRRIALYPPFVELVNILVTSPDPSAAARASARLYEILNNALAGENATLLGPAPAPLSKLRGSYRWHILLKCGEVEGLELKIKGSIASFHDYSRTFPSAAGTSVFLDVEPVSLL